MPCRWNLTESESGMNYISNNKTVGRYPSAIIAIILWGLSFVWTKEIINENIPVFTFLFIRLFTATVILVVFCSLAGKLQRVKRADVKWLVLMAFFEPFIYFIGESYGMIATNSATISAVIIASIPVFCIISERIFYRIPFTLHKIIGIIITLPGIALVAFEEGDVSVDHIYGLVLLFVAVIGATGYGTVVKKVADSYNNYTIATWQFGIGAAFFLPFFLFAGGVEGVSGNFFSFKVLYPLVSLAVLCSCVAFVLWINAIRGLGITKANIFSTLIPGISAIAAAAIGQESITWHRIAGIVVVIVGVALAQYSPKSNTKYSSLS